MRTVHKKKFNDAIKYQSGIILWWLMKAMNVFSNINFQTLTQALTNTLIDIALKQNIQWVSNQTILC